MQGAWQTLSDQALSLLATSLPRARVLVWSAIVEANHGLLPGLFLAVRSHFEMTALLAEFRLYLAGNAHPKETFERIFWANRSWTKSMTEAMASMAMNVDETKAEVDPRSVMHYIDAVDWLVLGKRLGPFRTAYDELSDHCHPNARARLAVPAVTETTIPADHLETAIKRLGVSHRYFREFYRLIESHVGGFPPERLP